jgi:DNA-binding GntR family transcriptional regulator
VLVRQESQEFIERLWRSGVSNILLREKAYEIIKERIINNTYEMGEMLSENALVQSLGMSRTPIRSALSLLDKEGLVKIVPQKGAIVVGMTVDEARDIFDLRIALESYVADQLAGALGEEDIRHLQNILREQEDAAKSGDAVAFVHQDFNFHLFLFAKHNNKRMIDIMRNLRDRMIQCGAKALSDEERFNQTLSEHYAVMRALVNPAENQPGLMMRKHLENGRARFLNHAGRSVADV